MSHLPFVKIIAHHEVHEEREVFFVVATEF